MTRALPRGFVGALGGALGILPLLPIAATVARRFARVPSLPGAELLYGDVKLASYGQALVFLLAVPVSAWVFGWLLPHLIERRAPQGRLSFEWVGAAFGLAYPIALAGLRPKLSLLAGILCALASAALLLHFRRSLTLRRFFSRRGLYAALWLTGLGVALDLARLAASHQRFDPSRRLLPELVLAGLSLTVVAATLCIAVTKNPAARFRRIADASGPALFILAGALAFPVAFTPLALVAVAYLAFSWALPPTGRAFPVLARVGLIVFVSASAWRMEQGLFYWIDPFEDGCSLAPADIYLRGGVPYRDLVPIHGWGADGGVDARAFRVWGSDLRVFRLRRAVFSATAFVFLFCASIAALRGWGALAFLFALCIGGVTFERQALAFGALALLLIASRRRRRREFVLAGILAGLELMHSLDYGIILLVGGLLGLFLLGLLEPGSRGRLRAAVAGSVLWYFGGALVAATPFLARLSQVGALRSFFRSSFVEAPAWVEAAWGLPVVDLWQSLLHTGSVAEMVTVLAGTLGTRALFVLAVLAASGSVLLLRASTKVLDRADGAVVVSWSVAAVAMRVVLGRADEPHLSRYGLFAAIPAAWLLSRAWKSDRRALFAATAVLLAVRLRPVGTLENAARSIAYLGGSNAPVSTAHAPRDGGMPLMKAEADLFNTFRRTIDLHLGPDDTFFDFANQPALYFIADRALPTRYFTVAQYEEPSRQNEVVAALERARPGAAILPRGLYGNLDGVSNAERAPLVAKYLAQHYTTGEEVGGWLVAWRRPDR